MKQIAYIIDFEPAGQRIECRKNETVLDCAIRNGVGINNICGRKGKCRSCKVQVLSGETSKLTSAEQSAFSSMERNQGWRLACQVYPHGNLKVNVPPESMTTRQRVQTEGLEGEVCLELPVQAYQLELGIPSISDAQSDDERLLQSLNRKYGLHCNKIDLDAIRTIPGQLRSWNWQCQALVRDNEVIAICDNQKRHLGLAIDLGTTKVAGYLVNLDDGHTLAADGIMNPQICYGEDIISRINAAIVSPDDSVTLKNVIVEGLNKLIEALCNETGAQAEEILEVVIVGNTAMHHLLLNLPVKQLACSPFVPAVSKVMDIKARDLNLNVAPGAYVHLMPNVAGFIGSDHVAMLLAGNLDQSVSTTLALDIGTNTEVSLVHKGGITSVSCASGPAFEGGHIKCGMRAGAGAIERVRIANGNIEYQTVENEPPAGICGSGILDVIAQLYIAEIISEDGNILENHPNVRTKRGQREFVLVSEEERGGRPAIVITQHDIRELQLAKAAVRSGIQILLEANNCTQDDINQVIVAGAFGTYLDITSAILIGMLPALPLNRFQQVGNLAGIGAKLALLSLTHRAEAQRIAAHIKYIELSGVPNFEKVFIQASYFGKYEINACTGKPSGSVS